MKDFKVLLNEKLFNNYIFEGIDIDIKNKIVTFTDNHENYVDTSGKLTKKVIDDIETYMLFKRKKSNGIISDGSPLVHALKGNYGWKIANKEDILNRIKETIKGIPDFDVIIIVPSSNPLMKDLAKYFKGKVIKNCLIKKTKEEVINEMDFSVFTDDELEEIDNAFKKMDLYFESKYFPKKLFSKLSVSIYKANKITDKIIGKSVLIIDDTISSGYTLSSCSKVIKEQYFPKKVSQFSLFSDL